MSLIGRKVSRFRQAIDLVASQGKQSGWVGFTPQGHMINQVQEKQPPPDSQFMYVHKTGPATATAYYCRANECEWIYVEQGIPASRNA